ncbi:MAG: oxidoreductase [Chitinophagaceae bacterium]|nr:oxidoreductase [Chitinophagaceae bacterium]
MNLQKTILLFLLLACKLSLAQTPVITLLDSGRNVSIRGLSVVDEQTIWCSGSKGSVARSTDGGQHFSWLTVPGYEQRDFRDIHAFDAHTALIMGIGEPAIILRTKDGGQSWQKVFEDSTKGMFLDAMDFDRKGKGVVIGDPVGGYLFRADSKDFGDTWVKAGEQVALGKGEAFFASSGTNIQATGKRKHPYIFASGGLLSKLYYKGKVYSLPLLQGKESTGANSIAVRKRKAVVVGGDYLRDRDTNGNCILVNLRRKPVFADPQQAPKGYRSCVLYLDKKVLLSCGINGVDISDDQGLNWHSVSKLSFHVVQKAAKGKAVFLAGPGGKIARLQLPDL